MKKEWIERTKKLFEGGKETNFLVAQLALRAPKGQTKT